MADKLMLVMLFLFFSVFIGTLGVDISIKRVSVCKESLKDCNFLLSRGYYTCQNGGMLWRFCPVSCKLCTVCEDKRSGCETFMEKKFCTNKKISAYIRKSCMKSCGICKDEPLPKLKEGCQDYEPLCPKWVAIGDCISEQTKLLCPKGCGLCGKKSKMQKWKNCTDTKPSICNGEYTCISKKSVAKISCRKSCGMCEVDGTCYDHLSYCQWYQKKSYCTLKRYESFMKKNCPFSCKFC